MGIKRLLIDSWTVWYGHTKTDPDRRRDREEGAATPVAAESGTPACSSMCSGLIFNDCCSSQRVGLSAFGGHSNDSMGGPSTPLM